MPYQLLSKSKYLSGLQCSRLIWIEVNEPDRIPETDPVTQYIFDQGHQVGELAKKLFPNGIDIPTDNFMENIRQTGELLEQRRPLFEAGILADGLYSRVDILNPVNEDEWDIVEVKSSTSVKDVHINDVAYQRYCCRQYGLNIFRDNATTPITTATRIKHKEVYPSTPFTASSYILVPG